MNKKTKGLQLLRASNGGKGLQEIRKMYRAGNVTQQKTAAIPPIIQPAIRLYLDGEMSISGDTLSFTPSGSNIVSLHDGEIWHDQILSEAVTLDMAAFTTDKKYDIFLDYEPDTESVKITSTAWTNESTRGGTIVSVDGANLDAADYTRRLIGTIRYPAEVAQMQSSNGVIVGSGDPYAGDFTGVAMLAPGIVSGSASYEFVGMEGGTLNVGIDNRGRMLAGGGAVILDDNGIFITAGTAPADINSYKFLDSSGNLLGRISQHLTASLNSLNIFTYGSGTTKSKSEYSVASLQDSATIYIVAQGYTTSGGPGPLAAIQIISNASAGDISLNAESADIDTTIYGDTRAVITVDAGTDTAQVSRLNLEQGATLTISGGIITVTHSNHVIDTESSAATDDLDTINGGASGDILVLRSNNNGRDITLKDGTGNLALAGDFTLSNIQDTIMLMFGGTNWIELSRSDNA